MNNGCIAPWQSTTFDGPYTIKVQFHKLGGLNGMDVTNEQIEESKIILKNTFDQLNINFNFNCGIITHNIEVEIGIGTANFCEIGALSIPYHLNIFVGSPSAEFMAIAESIPGTWVIVSGSDNRFNQNIPAYNSNILVHEVGHCLGLFHTHFGTNEQTISNNELETANYCGPSNVIYGCHDNSVYNGECFDPISFMCGDCVCDTPPEPNLNNNFFISFDPNGNCIYGGPPQYEPLMNNIMSYTAAFCLEEFTYEQIWRMKSFLNSNHSKAIFIQSVDIGSNLNITSIGSSWNYSHYNDKIFIKSGASYTIKNINAFVTKNFEIIVESGGVLNIENSSIRSCSELYKGITAENGSIVNITSNSNISDALYGLDIKQNATISIKNSFINDCYIGLKLESGANLNVFENNTIQTLNGVKPTTHTGADFWSESTYCGILMEPNSVVDIGYNNNNIPVLNTFKNIGVGIYSNAGRVLCDNALFEDISYTVQNAPGKGSAIYLKSSNYNYLKNNTINYCDNGIIATRGSALNCIENTMNVSDVGIGSYTNFGKWHNIKDNVITSHFNGIESFDIGGAIIQDNFISAGHESDGIPAVGIAAKLGGLNQIIGNSVDFHAEMDKQVGILSSLAGNTIKDNIISSDHYSTEYHYAYALLGGKSSNVNCNLSFDFHNGIFLDNSSGNEISCNSIDSKTEDIRVDRNSLMQMMKGNSMNSNDRNLILTNPIGEQSHHGNKWYSTAVLGADATAFGSDPALVAASRFFYDKIKSDSQNKKWYPNDGSNNVNSDPVGLFFTEPEQTSTYECTSCVEGDFFQWFNSNPSPTALCQWLKSLSVRISPKRVNWWKKYIYRLVKKSGIPYSQLSQCIKDLIDELEGKKQVHVENVREKMEQLSLVYNTPTIKAKYEEINTLINNARASNGPVNHQTLLNKLNELQSLIDGRDGNIATLRSDILSSLALFDNDAEYEEEHILYSALSAYVLSDVIPQDRTAIEHYASNCSEEYGENVYLAKALLSITNKIDPISLSCEEAEERSRKSTEFIVDKIIVKPTVSNGLYTVLISSENNYELTIFNSVGKLICKKNNVSEYYELDLSNETNGIYLLVLKDGINGNIITKKVIKQ